MNKIEIIYCCKDCGNKISRWSAFYGKGRCFSCANKGENNPSFGCYGKLNSNYKDGRSIKSWYCIECQKRINYQTACYGKGRCRECYGKWYSEVLIGNKNPNYKDGRTNKKYFCVDCGKKITVGSGFYGNSRCKSCAKKGVLNFWYGI